MTIRKQRPKIGDLLEIKLPRGLAYVQYVGRHAEYGDAIWVRPTVYRIRPADFGKLIDKAGYLTFYPARAAVSQGLTQVVASSQLPHSISIPHRYRRVGARSRDGKVLTWIIVDDGRETLRHTLNESERKLPIAAIWNHQMLCDRIDDQWFPESEG